MRRSRSASLERGAMRPLSANLAVLGPSLAKSLGSMILPSPTSTSATTLGLTGLATSPSHSSATALGGGGLAPPRSLGQSKSASTLSARASRKGFGYAGKRTPKRNAAAASAAAAAAAAGAETSGDGASTLVWNCTNEPAPARETPTGKSPGTARRRKGRGATKLGRRSGNGAGGKRGNGNRAGGKSSGQSRSLANKLRAETRSTRPPPPRPATQGVWGTGKENPGNGGGFTPHSAMDGGPSVAARAVVLGGAVSEGLAGKSDNTFRQVQHPARCVVATHTGRLHGRPRLVTFALYQRSSPDNVSIHVCPLPTPALSPYPL